MSDVNKNQQESRGLDQTYLQFGLGGECYAIHLLAVKEVIPPPETTPLPNSPAHYVGIMNLRGQIISIIDLRKKLNIGPQKENAEEAVIITEIQGVGVGVIVDSINRVINLSMNSVSEVPEINSQVNAQYIEGVHQDEKGLTILLDLGRMLNINTIKNMQKKAS